MGKRKTGSPSIPCPTCAKERAGAIAIVDQLKAERRAMYEALNETRDVICGAGLVEEFPAWVIDLIDAVLGPNVDSPSIPVGSGEGERKSGVGGPDLKAQLSAQKIDRLTNALRRVAVTLRRYEYCRHAVLECFCTAEARASIRDLQLLGIVEVRHDSGTKEGEENK